jgi:hypothetical protein
VCLSLAILAMVILGMTTDRVDDPQPLQLAKGVKHGPAIPSTALFDRHPGDRRVTDTQTAVIADAWVKKRRDYTINGGNSACVG